jgi:hypothetical protein
MRTCNNHPQWFNQPLRLTEEERKNPLLVLKEFFECYHLNDTRNINWNWLVEILSSTGSISSEALDRNNHIFFYEKLEALIEACYLIVSAPEIEKNIELVLQPTAVAAGQLIRTQ